MITSSPGSINRSHRGVERRSDGLVRRAITDIQSLLFDPQASSRVFSLVLEHMISITESEYGVCFVSDTKAIKPIPRGEGELPPLVDIYGQSRSIFINTTTLRQWLSDNTLSLRPSRFEAPFSKRFDALITDPNVKSIIVLPVMSRGNLRAVCILGKRTEVYSESVISRLLPLMGAVVCALQSGESINAMVPSIEATTGDAKFYSTVLALSPVAIITVASDNTIVNANPSAHQIFGSQDEPIALLGQPIKNYAPDFEALFLWSNQRSRYGSAVKTDESHILNDQSFTRANGQPFLANVTVFRHVMGPNRLTVLQIQDVSALKVTTEEHHNVAQQLSALTHLVPVGIIYVDSDWQCIYANHKWYDFSGLVSHETLGEQWVNAIHTGDVEDVLKKLRRSLEKGHDLSIELRLISPLGSIRWVEFATRVLFDSQGQLQGFLGTFADITDRLIYQEKLRLVAEYDYLTGLANRNLFQDRLQQALYSFQRDKRSVYVMFLDLDGFKDVNDTFGHEIGDKMLKEVSNRLLGVLRRDDTVARFGGDEFVVLLGKLANPDNVALVADKIIQAVSKPYRLDGQDAYVTVSIGIAKSGPDSHTIDGMLKQADDALYLAKNSGKNKCQMYDDALNKRSNRRVYLISQLRNALSENKYTLYFQPIASAESDQVVGFEALLRFVDTSNETIEPDEFIPLLEENSMIIDVGRWVIDQTCLFLKQLCDNQQMPLSGFISFNVSVKQLLDDTIVDDILSACRRHQVDPSYLVMEITESVIINKPKQVETVLDAIKQAGIRLAIDDFGTGYSSLSYLQRYPFDHIKIDRSFVNHIDPKSKEAKIVRAIVALADSMGINVTAEGVEEVEALHFLKDAGVNYFQGFLLSPPEPSNVAVKCLSLNALAVVD